jgi:hypothetical protein
VIDAGKVEIGGSPAIQPLVKGVAFSANLSTLLTALSTYAGADIPVGPNPGGAALIAAVSAFLAALPSNMSLKSFTQ